MGWVGPNEIGQNELGEMVGLNMLGLTGWALLVGVKT